MASDISTKSTMQTAQVNYFLWERCPAEIRDMTFDGMDGEGPDYHWYFDWNGYMPPLVTALRGLKKSYQHALQRFVRDIHSTVWMNWATEFRIEDMNRIELQTIKILRITTG
jgi:hypothetical protein